MQLKITQFIWQQEGIGHEFVIDWEETLQSADNNAKYVLLSKMVHERISIEDAHIVVFYYVQIVVS